MLGLAKTLTAVGLLVLSGIVRVALEPRTTLAIKARLGKRKSRLFVPWPPRGMAGCGKTLQSSTQSSR
jgi:hypothetical protein